MEHRTRIPGLAFRYAKRGWLSSKFGWRCWGGWLQLLALLSLILQPLTSLRAVYVRDAAGNPSWFPMYSSDAEPPDGPNWTPDSNGVPQWMDDYQWAVEQGIIVWWGGGTYLISGSWVYFPAQYHLGSSGDSDSDGIPDDLDPFPTDANNNTFWWSGGTFTIENNSRSFDSAYYAGAWQDSDGDGFPDVADPYPYDANNGNSSGDTQFWWNGGTFTINNASYYFSPGQYSGTWADNDWDGIPDVADPYPYDANNGNTTTLEFWWEGGTFLIDAVSVTFNSGYYGGQWSDGDGDGLPDVLDPYPNDGGNDTAWWGGGTFMVDGSAVTLAGQYHRGNAGDADVDGIPDDLDPYPNDPTNGTFWWDGGTFEVNASPVTFLSQYYAGTAQDSDSDGIPDILDPYAQDASNNTFWWQGGTFLINGEWCFYEGQYYVGTALDSDGDGIPDVLDPYPNDPWNNTYFSWTGGTFSIDGVQVTFPETRYGGAWSDRDSDGIPDVADPYPDDGSNNTAWWGGGTFMIDGNWTSLSGQYHRADAVDADLDNIPDDLDPRPNDSSNNSYYWSGGSFTIADSPVYFPAQYYAGDGRDSDADGILDVLDPYPNDSNNGNNNNEFWWAGGTFTIDNNSVYFNAGFYSGTWSDSDGDGIPDVTDPYPSDANNNNSNNQFYWGGGTFTINNASSYFAPAWYSGSWQDSDGDGIPDVADPCPYDENNGNHADYWWDGGTFTIDGLQTYIPGQFYSSWMDSDGDGIPDFADPYLGDYYNNTAWWAGGSYLVNGMEAMLSAAYHRANAGDADSDGIPDDLDPYPNDPYNGSYFLWPSQVTTLLINNQQITFSPTLYATPETDLDSDGIPDVADPYPNDPTNNNDTDGDGIPDRIELQYSLNPNDPSDASIVRADGLTNLQAYQAGLSLDAPPMDPNLDSDGDGMSDVYEIINGLDRFNRADAAAAPRGDFVFNVEKARGGLSASTVVNDASVYFQLTGHTPGGLTTNQWRSVAENDWDGDGISNIDELLVFHTDPRSSSFKPTQEQIREVLFEGKCSLTTRSNFFWMLLDKADTGNNPAGGIEGGMSGGNPHPSRLPNGAVIIPPPIYNGANPGGGGDGPLTDGDHDPNSPMNIKPPGLTVVEGTRIDADSGFLTPDPTTAHLEWEVSVAPTSIEIQRRDGAADWITIGGGGAGAGTHEDHGRRANVSYHYRLVATFANGQKLFSNVVPYSFSFYKTSLTRAVGAARVNPGFPEFVPSDPPKFYLTKTSSSTSNYSDSEQNFGEHQDSDYTSSDELNPIPDNDGNYTHTFSGESNYTENGWVRDKNSQQQDSIASWGEVDKATRSEDGTWHGKRDWWNVDADGIRTSGEESWSSVAFGGYVPNEVDTATLISGADHSGGDNWSSDLTVSIELTDEYAAEFFVDTIGMADAKDITKGWADAMDIPPDPMRSWWERIRDVDNYYVGVERMKWDVETYPSVAHSETFYVVFVPSLPLYDFEGDSSDLPPPRIVDSVTVDEGGLHYELDTGAVPDGFAPDGQPGRYYFIQGLQVSAGGFLPDKSSPNGALGVSLLDPEETRNGAAILHPPGAGGGGGLAGAVYVSGNPLPGGTWTVLISNPSHFKVTDGLGNIVNNGDVFNHPVVLFVIPNAYAGEGERVTITVSERADIGDLGSESVVFTNTIKGFDPKDYSIPVDEASGARYRKISLTGRPMADEKPQQTDESDQEKEETYIDALTLGLNHNTTDVYVPVPGSDLAITARRNTVSEVWNMNNGLRPHERFDRPFGAAWASNLCPYVETIYTNDGGNYTYVVDQNGARHRFLPIIDPATNISGYVPVPSDSRENGDYLTMFDGITFTDRYGTQITFGGGNVEQRVSTNRNEYSGSEWHIFGRASKIADRLGNTLTYAFPSHAAPDGSTANTIRTLIPSTIKFSGALDQTLSIAQDESGHVRSIWDPNGNRFDYTYESRTYSMGTQQYAETVLSAVTDPEGHQTRYDYALAIETDLTPPDITNGQPTDKMHLDVSSITDPKGNTYQFTYGFDQTKYNYDAGAGGHYPQTGAPSYVKQVDLPGSSGAALFSNLGSKTALNPQTDSSGTMHLTSDSNRQTHVTDAGGNAIVYQWKDDHVFVVGGVYPNTPPAAIPKVVFYNTMDIVYALGTEEFTFEPAAGMALKSVKDFSGNTTTYSYEDSYNPPAGSIYSKIFPYPAFATKYPDPTSQTDAFGNSKVFHYATQYRIMDSVKDEAGRSRVYQLDDLGRRLAEHVLGSNGTTLQVTDFGYDTHFPGVVTSQTVRNLDGRTLALEVDKQLDPNGRVAVEIVNPHHAPLVTSYEYDRNGNKRKVTDPRGHLSGFEYDKRNRLTKVIYADGSSKIIDYQANGNKWQEKDENGHTTSFEYDALNRLLSQTRSGIVTQYRYTDAVQPKTTVVDPDAHQTHFHYDSLQRLSQITDALGHSTSYDYTGGNAGAHAFDSSGFKPTQISDARGYRTLITYDELYRPHFKSVEIAPLQFATSRTDYDYAGNPITVTDPLGRATNTEFDALNRPVQVINPDGSHTRAFYSSTGLKWKVQDELGNETETEYDGAGRPTAVMGPLLEDGVTRATTHTVYDNAGNVIATINPLGQEWDYVYDLRNRKIEEHQPAVLDGVSGQDLQPVIYTGYDYVGNVLWVQDARGFTTETIYDAANRPVTVTAPPVVLAGGGGPVRPVTSKSYDPAGNVLTVTDCNGNITINTYDAVNRLKSTTDAENIMVSYDYDAVGNRILVQDGLQQATTFTYDGLNRNTATIDASGHSTQFGYDAVNKILRTDALGQKTHYGYDARNRLTSVSYEDRTGEDRGYSYDAAGDLLAVTEPGKGGVADVGYTYDHMRRVVKETSGGARHLYSYDLAGNRLSVQYGLIGGGNGRQIVSTYDELNRLSTLTDSQPSALNSQLVTVYDYDLGGNIVGKTLPNGDAVVTHYDSMGRAYEEEGVSLQGVLYYYLSLGDAAGNLKSSFEYTANLPLRSVAMDYDAIDRLTRETVTDSNGTVVSDTGYGYDAANNRTRKLASGVITTYSFNNTNELTAWSDTQGKSASYGYDSNGNRLSRSANGASDTYTYDAENRLTGLSLSTLNPQLSTVPGSYSYQYDYRTRRISRTENGTTTAVVYSGGTSVQEYPSTSSGPVGSQPSAEYIRGSDWGGGVGGILYTMRGGSASFDHYDRRGDVTSKTDNNGAVTWQASYEAFGTRTQEQGATQDRQKANTKEEDPTGLLDEGMRYRDLETGTFITRDPAGFVDGPNLYAYVRQNPWTKFDPEGLDSNAHPQDEDEYSDPLSYVIDNAPKVGAKFVAGGVIGYSQVTFGVNKNFHAGGDNAVAAGLNTGRVVAGAQASVEVIGGGALTVGGGTVSVTGAGAVIGVPAAEIGVAVAGAGVYGLKNYSDLGLERMNQEGGSSGSPGGETAKQTGEKSQAKVEKDVTVDYNKHPEAAQHIDDAQAAGHPDVVTVDRPNTPSQRDAATGHLDKVPGKQLDEYPPAFSQEGGQGASVRPISPSDNMGAGAAMGNQIRGVPNGAKVRIKTINKPTQQ